MISLPPSEPPRVLAGRIVDTEHDFTFEVWAPTQLPADEVQRAYRDFLDTKQLTGQAIHPGTVVRQLTGIKGRR